MVSLPQAMSDEDSQIGECTRYVYGAQYRPAVGARNPVLQAACARGEICTEKVLPLLERHGTKEAERLRYQSHPITSPQL